VTEGDRGEADFLLVGLLANGSTKSAQN